MKVRIQFKKEGCMKFVGHLDIMRFFQKAMKRANIDIAYSEGFNPHQKMSFASPLGLGLTSVGEYLDIEINSFISSDQAIDALNAVMVEGISITQFSYLPDHAVNAMSSIQAAEYHIYEKEKSDNLVFTSQDALNSFCEDYFGQDEIIVTKETKKGETTFDLKPCILGWETTQNEEGKVVLDLIVKAGSETNIKPEFVLTNILRYHHMDDDLMKYHFHRIDLYTFMDDEYVSLGDIGTHANDEIHTN